MNLKTQKDNNVKKVRNYLADLKNLEIAGGTGTSSGTGVEKQILNKKAFMNKDLFTKTVILWCQRFLCCIQIKFRSKL